MYKYEFNYRALVGFIKVRLTSVLLTAPPTLPSTLVGITGVRLTSVGDATNKYAGIDRGNHAGSAAVTNAFKIHTGIDHSNLTVSAAVTNAFKKYTGIPSYRH